MKKIFLLSSLVFIFITSFGQQLPEGKTAEYYKHKAVKQKSLGWTLFGSGFGVMLISIPLYPKDYSFLFNSPETEKKATAAEVVTLIGFAGMVTSVPFFIASGVNRRKSRVASVGLKFENRLVPQQYSLTKKEFPVVSLKISL